MELSNNFLPKLEKWSPVGDSRWVSPFPFSVGLLRLYTERLGMNRDQALWVKEQIMLKHSDFGSFEATNAVILWGNRSFQVIRAQIKLDRQIFRCLEAVDQHTLMAEARGKGIALSLEECAVVRGYWKEVRKNGAGKEFHMQVTQVWQLAVRGCLGKFFEELSKPDSICNLPTMEKIPLFSCRINELCQTTVDEVENDPLLLAQKDVVRDYAYLQIRSIGHCLVFELAGSVIERAMARMGNPIMRRVGNYEKAIACLYKFLRDLTVRDLESTFLKIAARAPLKIVMFNQ